MRDDGLFAVIRERVISNGHVRRMWALYSTPTREGREGGDRYRLIAHFRTLEAAKAASEARYAPWLGGGA